ncbi:MAG TPA: nitroreductase family deazaflavin-dependent oxidoreductase [Ktedonobacterales bacterium]|nr:nitroreductase family deazaflavin-dependent oxidoreductase [Ktedonobacterales bacterium]
MTTWRRVWWRRWLQRGLTTLHIASYRATGGLIGHRLGPLPNVLLTTIGRRSGKPRTTALTYIRADGLLALVASNFGSRTAPQWYRNLQAHPEATVQLQRQRWPVRMRPATPDEYERIWSVALTIWPAWAGYADRAQRDIPIVVLEQIQEAPISGSLEQPRDE